MWPPSFVVARAYLDQLERDGGLPAAQVTAISASLGMAEQQSGPARTALLTSLAARLDKSAIGAKGAARVRALSATVKGLAAAE